MKVKIKPYVNYIGPHQIAEKVLFWKDPYSDDVFALGYFLSGKNDDSLLLKVCQSLYKYRTRKSRAKVHIDPYDTWSMDGTLAYIILPMLKQLKQNKHGSAIVDDEDVPEDIRLKDVHEKWSWVLDEMIWAFDYKTKDKDDYNQENEKRMSNAFILFGKYYQGLWD